MKDQSRIIATGRDAPNQIVVDFSAGTTGEPRTSGTEDDDIAAQMEALLEADRRSRNILTQEEIDALLAAAETPAEESASPASHETQSPEEPCNVADQEPLEALEYLKNLEEEDNP